MFKKRFEIFRKKEKRERHYHSEEGHESVPVEMTQSVSQKQERPLPPSEEVRRAAVFDPHEFEDDDEEAAVEHVEDHPAFPLEKKALFYLGLAILIIPTAIATPTPIPSWLVLPLVSPIAFFFMAKGVGKEHANWHIKAVPRKIRIGLKNFLRGIFG